MLLGEYLYNKFYDNVSNKINTKELRDNIKLLFEQELLEIFSINKVLKQYTDNEIYLYNQWYGKVRVKCDEENNSPDIVYNKRFRIDVLPSNILACDFDPITKILKLEDTNHSVCIVW